MKKSMPMSRVLFPYFLTFVTVLLAIVIFIVAKAAMGEFLRAGLSKGFIQSLVFLGFHLLMLYILWGPARREHLAKGD